MTTRKMYVIKKKVLTLFFITCLLTGVSFLPGLQYSLSSKTLFDYYLTLARSRITYWGLDGTGGTGPIDLDPGGGGSGGYTPDKYLKVLLSYDATEEIHTDQVKIVESNFTAHDYFVFLSYAQDQTDFAQDLVDANTLASKRLCISFVGEGTMVSVDGSDTPALVMKNGETISKTQLRYTRLKVSSWVVYAVFLYSCYSLASDDLAEQFSRMGAKVVFGYEDKVETTLATEITNLFWTNYKVNQTSLEGAFVQTKEAYKHAHNLATFLYNIILGLPDVLLELLILAGESGILATALWLISIFWGEFFAAL
ncbi:MAG: hypothetical protein ACTSYD_14630, partial [Candidatus Heimdallarchaeaceae archaeon]